MPPSYHITSHLISYIPKLNRHDRRRTSSMRRLIARAPGPHRVADVPAPELDLRVIAHRAPTQLGIPLEDVSRLRDAVSSRSGCWLGG
jgi:hypothetical protein